MFFLGTESLSFYRLTGPDIGMNFTHGLFRSGLIKSDMWYLERKKKSQTRAALKKTSDDWIRYLMKCTSCLAAYTCMESQGYIYRCSLTRVSHHPPLFSYLQCFIRSEVTFKNPYISAISLIYWNKNTSRFDNYLIKIRSFELLLIVVIYQERIKGSNFN